MSAIVALRKQLQLMFPMGEKADLQQAQFSKWSEERLKEIASKPMSYWDTEETSESLIEEFTIELNSVHEDLGGLGHDTASVMQEKPQSTQYGERGEKETQSMDYEHGENEEKEEKETQSMDVTIEQSDVAEADYPIYYDFAAENRAQHEAINDWGIAEHGSFGNFRN